ncbi:energy-coupling factor transporter ATPase [Propionispira raffinosivorans]|uniref:energy-coupling factor transporter ATPase n=1 Tax=Propionispira raffinosivorans TaxID=86959 RepID=UPI0003704AD0|nr:energy-coupling factor transporter ATPase [Propionispira raffinosivorans]
MSIEVKNITYTYMAKTPFERVALKNIDLTIEKGEFIAIIGHTGSGKSTLVQHLNALLTPTIGSVLVDGNDINTKNEAAKTARRKVGMVFQYPEHQLFEETVYEDIAFGPHNMGFSEELVENHVKKAMEFVNLDFDEYKDRSPFQLSGGQMRRVAIAGVIALNPQYLILDEPTAGLDPIGRKDLFKKIQQIHKKEKIAIVLVSHNMDDVAALADRIIVMNHGEITIDAKPKQAFSQIEQITEAGLAVPHMTALLEQLKQNGMAVDTTPLTLGAGVDSILAAIRRRK